MVGSRSRMPEDRLPFIVLFGQISGPGIRGRLRDTWKSIVQKDLTELNMSSNWFSSTADRLAWRQVIDPVHT